MQGCTQRSQPHKRHRQTLLECKHPSPILKCRSQEGTHQYEVLSPLVSCLLAKVPKVVEQARVALLTAAGVEVHVEPKLSRCHILQLPAGGRHVACQVSVAGG